MVEFRKCFSNEYEISKSMFVVLTVPWAVINKRVGEMSNPLLKQEDQTSLKKKNILKLFCTKTGLLEQALTSTYYLFSPLSLTKRHKHFYLIIVRAR